MQTETIRPTGSETAPIRRAAAIGLGGAFITVAGATFSQILRGSSSVSTDRWSFPFGARAHVLLAVLWACSHALLFVGLNGIRRSGLVGERRAGVAAINLSLAGTTLLGVGEIASMWLANAKADAGGAVAVGSVFGLGTLLTAIGMVIVGIIVVRDGRWTGPGKAAPLVFGLVNAVQMALGPTDLFHIGIIAYGSAAAWLMIAFGREAGDAGVPTGQNGSV